MGKKKGGGGKGPQQQQGQGQQQQQPQQQPQQPPQQQQQPPQQQQQPPQQQQQPQQQQAQAQQQRPPQQQTQQASSDDFPSLGGGRGGGRGGRGWGRGQPQDGGGGGDEGGRGRGGRGGGRGSDKGGQQQHQQQGGGDVGRGGGGGGRGRGRGDGERGGYQQQQQYRAPHESAGPSPPATVHSDEGGRGRGGWVDRGGRGGWVDRGGRGGERGGRGGGRGRGGQDQQEYRQPPPQQAYQPPPQQAYQSPPTQPMPMDEGAASVTKGMQEMGFASPPSGGGEKKTYKPSGLWPIPIRKIKMDKNGMVGTRGKPIPIEVNHLSLVFKKTGIAIHYDCNFDPDVPKKLLRDAMEQMRKRHYPNRYPAFDGRKNMYSCGPLPLPNDEIHDTVAVKDPDRDKPKEFKIKIKRVNEVDMSQIGAYLANGHNFPQDAIQALDIVLRNPSSMRFTPVGRSYFTRPTNQILSLGNGLELWYGFYQSAILGWKPFLNVDVAHKGFPEPKDVLEVMLDQKAKYMRYNDPPPTLRDLSEQGLGRNELDDFVKFLRGLKVEYILPNQPNSRRVFKVNGIKKNALEQRFTIEEEKRTITVGEYYQRDKRCPIRYPKLPLLHVGPPQKEICVPAEFCRVMMGQAINRKMDETQTAAMVKAAARPADERKRRIMDAMRNVGFNRDPCLNEFGVQVGEQFEKIKARVLDPPKLEYKEGDLKPRAGVWRAGKFVSAHALTNWVVMSLAGRTRIQDLKAFAQTMIGQGRQLGMNIAEPLQCVVVGDECRDLRNANGPRLQQIVMPYFQKYKKEGCQLVVVVIPDRPFDSYSKVKLSAEVNVGILTQCIKERTMGRMNPATAGNILLKLNAKLNGVNHTVDRAFCPHIMNAPVMLVGADVTHPSPDQTNIPSVAAVAASHDRRAFQYNMIWRLQPPRQEIIDDLQNIMRQQLMFFYKKTGQKPLKVIFYRDGVSEGQFSQVLEGEMSAIRRACSSLNAEYKPSVTFLVVQKRHHTRFFPTRPQDEDGRNKNVPPGTIVDTVITHPKEVDFYLVSHASLQGTSRPTKYHKLWDENDIGEDDLEELTYYLCHLFSRCTRAVSYPAPTYYAHLAAARGRVYLEGSQINLTNLAQEMRTRIIQDVITKDSPMFFV